MKYIFRTLLFAAFFAVFESAVLARIYFFPILPDILLIFLEFVSLRSEKHAALTFAFVFGFIIDCVSMAPFGLNAVCFLPVALAICVCRGAILNGMILIPCIVTGISFCAKAALILLLSFIYGDSIATYKMDAMFLIELSLNVVLSPLLFRFFGLFSAFLFPRTAQGAE